MILEKFISFNRSLLKFRYLLRKQQFRANSQNVNIFINGKEVSVPSYFTVGQALRRERVTIPSFCFHDRLSVAGNCRMCIIELEGMPKLQVACAIPVSKNMRVRTNTPKVFAAQEGILEFLLADHPLDCPICDQGGECDLQDLSVRFGNDRSRYTDIHFDGKRAVEHKELSVMIRAVMTRCIHCTRCIRFASQVCGLDVLGTTGRGYDMLVGTYVDKEFYSELSGNIIDLCPVGALTAIPYMFKARSWEVASVNSIDVLDATGTNIVVNSRFNRVLRVLPREHDEINQEWLSDKGRWAIDSLEMQRLVVPLVKVDKCCYPLEWDCALTTACRLIKCVKPYEILAIAGPHTNVETLVTCKDFLNMLGCEHTYIARGLSGLRTSGDIRAAYCLNMKMSDVAKADVILLVGTNPRFEAPILNAWIREAYRVNEADIYVVGPECEYNYFVRYLGDQVKCIESAAAHLTSAKHPLIFVGIDQLDTPLGGSIMKTCSKIAESCKQSKDWQVLHVLPLEASFVGALEAGWKPGGREMLLEKKDLKLIISLGEDEIFCDWGPKDKKNTKMIYIGFQGDRGAEFADLILPGSAYTEAGGLYLNMECRSQYALPAVTPPGKARHDWKIIRAIAQTSGFCLSYSDHNTLCGRLAQISPLFSCLGKVEKRIFVDLVPKMIDEQSGVAECPLNVEMRTLVSYYCSDIFTYNSPTMVQATKAVKSFLKSPYSPV